MSVFILAAMLVLQDADVQPTAAPDEATEAVTPVIPPTDAATLIAQIEGRLAAYADTVSRMAGRKASERYLSELLLPVISRTDLEDGARGEILAALAERIRETEDSNNQWALRQIDPDSFVILWTENPRLGSDLLRMAQRDPDSRQRLVAALEPVALAGAYDGEAYAVMADGLAMSNARPQPYGTALQCVDGATQIWPLADPETIDASRAALGLAPFDAETITSAPCEDAATVIQQQ